MQTRKTDSLDVRHEAHVQHPVHLVQHQVLQLTETITGMNLSELAANKI